MNKKHLLIIHNKNIFVYYRKLILFFDGIN